MAIALTAQQAYSNARYSPEQLRMLRDTKLAATGLDAAVDLLDERLASIVGRPRLGGERVGLLLSGGVESALTLALLVRAGYRPRCFTAHAAGSEDGEAAAALAHSFGVPWTGVDLTVEGVRARLEPVVRALGHWGVWSVASGLLLDALVTTAKRAGTHEVWTDSGLDVLFGGGAPRSEMDKGRGRTFHERFWERTLRLVERDYRVEDPINVYGTIGSVHGLCLRTPFEGFPTARLARRLDAGVLYGEEGQDKVPLRRLAERLGVPRELANRPNPTKAPLHVSSGMLGLLEQLMREDASLWCPDDLDHPSSATTSPGARHGSDSGRAEGRPSDEALLGLRYFLGRVASDVSPLRLMAAQVSARRRTEAPAPARAAMAPRRRARRR